MYLNMSHLSTNTGYLDIIEVWSGTFPYLKKVRRSVWRLALNLSIHVHSEEVGVEAGLESLIIVDSEEGGVDAGLELFPTCRQ
jgi:hypothetical protein